MKCSFLLVFVALLRFTANAAGQTPVSIHMKNVEIDQVFATLEKESGYHFLFNSRLTGIHKMVDVDVDNADISDVLKSIFTGTNLQYKMLDNKLIVISSSDVKQDRIVKGKVTGEKNEALANVSVTIKGVTGGTTTDESGAFTISVPDNAVLVFSSIGYTEQEVNVGTQTSLIVHLVLTTNSLNQVVVVGYGTQKKLDVTGAIAHVRGDELSKQPVLTATQALQGQVAGVQVTSSGQPGSLPQVVIRGSGSILAGGNPLYIVDGIWTSDITNINTADITSVDILKDASACSIYGVRGANGVILITTRQGTGKMKVNFSANIGTQQAAYIVPMANATQYINYQEAATGLPVTNTGFNTNWYDEVLRKAFYQNYNISVAGSSTQDKYALSVGYQTNQGVIINNDYSRYTIRFNNEYTPASFLKIGTTLSFAGQTAQNVPVNSITEDAYRAAPLVPAMVNGKFGNTSQYQNVGNPVLDAQSINDLSQTNKLQGSAYLEIKPVSFLTFRSTFGADLEFYNDRAYTYAHPNDTTFFNVTGGSQGPNLSTLTVANLNSTQWVWSNTLSYNGEFGKNKLTVLAGTEAQEYYVTSFSASRNKVPPVESEWYLQDGDQSTQSNSSSVQKYTVASYFGRITYSYDNRFLFNANLRADGSSVFNAANRWGYFPGVSAGWIMTNENFMQKQQVFQYLKIRASWGELGNSNVPADGSVPTTITNLPYFFNSGTAANGAVTGSISPQIKDLNIKWETTKETDLGFEYAILKGKLTGEFDVYDKRVDNALIYVQVPGTFGSQANPSSNITAGDVLTNAASIDNKGIEFSARWHDKINADLSYFIGGNISYNQNKVLSLNGGIPFFDGNINGYFTTETKAGYPIGSFFMRQVVGVFQSYSDINNYKDQNGNVLQSGAQPGDFKYKYNTAVKNANPNIPASLDTAFEGAYQPKMYVGMSGGINYKSFDFSFDIYSNIGNEVYNGKLQARVVATDNIESAVATNFWTSSNQSQTQPRANSGNLPASSYFIASGTFVRLNNLIIGYTLPAKIINKQKVITSCRIFFDGQNLVTLKKYDGFSSELPSASTVNNTGAVTANTVIPITTATNSGIDYNTYPTIRTFAFGVNLGL
jgi:TonB-linked SusC/RagA family outer membrane protein